MAVGQKFRPPKQIRPAQAHAQGSDVKSITSQASSSTQTQTPKQKITSVNKTESLQVVKTLLEASLGTIFYQRKLLPNDQFHTVRLIEALPPPGSNRQSSLPIGSQPSHITDSQLTSSQSLSQDVASQQPQGVKGKGFTYRALKPEQSVEGDKILGLLDGAVMDAVSKGYLRSVVLFVFLDSNDPNNILESYTFNFFYHGPSSVPQMDIVHNLGQMNLEQNSASASHMPPPVASTPDANEILGASRPIHHIGRSVKQFLTQLLPSCKALDDLPCQRFFDVKLFYNETVPVDYVAPGTKDATDETLFIGTHHLDRPPVTKDFGHLQTGCHGISVTAMSVTDQIPKRHLNDVDNVDELYKDADDRRIIWNAEVPAHDRQIYDVGSFDPYTVIDTRYQTTEATGESLFKQPMGVRDEGYNVLPLPVSPYESNLQGSAIQTESYDLDDHATRDHERSAGGSRSTKRKADESINDMTLASDTFRDEESTSMPTLTAAIPVESLVLLAPYRRSPPVNPGTSPLQSPSPFLGADADAAGETDDEAMDDMDSFMMKQLEPRSQKRVKQNAVEPARDPPQPVKNISTNNSRSTLLPKSSAAIVKASKPVAKEKSLLPKKSTKAKPRPKPKAKAIDKPAKVKNAAKKYSKASKKTVTSTQSLPALPKQVSKEQKDRMTAQRSRGDGTIDCFCGSKDAEGDTIQCDSCTKWYHTHCLGYEDMSEVDKVAEYVCVICEMEGDETRTWDRVSIEVARSTMSELSLVRRAVCWVRKEGGLSQSAGIPELRHYLGCTPQTMNWVISELKLQGKSFLKSCFIELASGNSGRPISAARKWSFQGDSSAATFRRYFDPGKGIEEDVLEYRKAHATPTQRQFTSSHPSHVSNTQSQDEEDRDVDMEDTHHEHENRNMSLRTPTSSGSLVPSLDTGTRFGLPVWRSSRALCPIDLSEPFEPVHEHVLMS
nr:uncharacterized protein CI109_000736 [Kwoniella shandongensis]KAA5530558.1 hypothetical protein CI109_000736 [Kwoniella shandongensis]